jgi:low temperature requirement protein LtrA
MFTVAALAANAKDTLGSESTAGFVAAYAVIRLVLVGQYARIRATSQASALATRYLIGHGIAALLWLASAFLDAPLRYAVWAVAAIIDFSTPWFAVPHTVDLPPDSAHLPERLGLFMIILLGDAVIAVMQGMESQETWRPAAAITAFLGMTILFLVWWWYFDGADAAAEQRVSTRRDAVRLHAWSYAHLPLYLAVIVTGVGLRRLVTAATHTSLGYDDTMILSGAAATLMAALAMIGAASGKASRRSSIQLAIQGALALATIVAGVLAGFESPLMLSVALSVLIGAQWVAALVGRRKRSEATVRPGEPLLADLGGTGS